MWCLRLEELGSSTFVQVPLHIAFDGRNQFNRQLLRLVVILKRRPNRISLTSTNHHHGYVGSRIDDRKGVSNPLRRWLWGVSEVSDQLLVLVQKRMLREQRCHVAIWAHP